MNFGTPSSDFKSAEQFLVKTIKKTSSASSFTELRKELFQTTTKGASHQNLPPTTQGVLPHIQRSCYNTNLILQALNNDSADILSPEQSGYKLQDGLLVPATSWKTLDQGFNTSNLQVSKVCSYHLSVQNCKYAVHQILPMQNKRSAHEPNDIIMVFKILIFI